jgi:hypothetical protein
LAKVVTSVSGDSEIIEYEWFNSCNSERLGAHLVVARELLESFPIFDPVGGDASN